MEAINGTSLLEKLQLNLLNFQDGFWHSTKRYPAFIGGWATGKTLFAIMRGIDLSQLRRNDLGLIVRKEFTDLRDSTVKDFERYTDLRLNVNKEVRFSNGSVIMFRHGDELNTLKNINLGWFMIEQAEEFETENEFEFLRGRLRRANVPFQTGFIIGNTKGHNWIWRIFKNNPPPEEYELFEANTFDNQQNLPKKYIEDLQRMEQESPHHYNRYVLNSWDDFEEQDTLIPYSFIKEATNRLFVPLENGGKILACDVARFGDDETVFTVLQDCGEKHFKQIYQEAYRHRDLMQTAGKTIDLKKEFNPEYIVIDDDGLGGGVSDRLIEQEISITRFRANEKPIRDEFYNKRTEQFWKLRELLRQGYLEILGDDELIQQLSTVKYKFKSNGKKFIEPKDEAKKRGIKSPDRADALMMACSVIDFVPEPKQELTPTNIFWNRIKGDIAYHEKIKETEEAENVFRQV